MGQSDYKYAVNVSETMQLAIEIQTDVIPHLRDSRYPLCKLMELESMLESVFENEKTRGRGPKKGAKYKKHKLSQADLMLADSRG